MPHTAAHASHSSPSLSQQAEPLTAARALPMPLIAALDPHSGPFSQSRRGDGISLKQPRLPWGSPGSDLRSHARPRLINLSCPYTGCFFQVHEEMCCRERTAAGLIKCVSFRGFAGWFLLNVSLLTSPSTSCFSFLFPVCILVNFPVLKIHAA